MPEIAETEIDLLRDRATRMGISFHPSIGLEKLKEKIAESTNSQPGTVTTEPKVETMAARNSRMRKEANKLQRIRLTCMNPAKKNWPGEMISVGNSAIGWIKKFIPFEAEDGWHIPAVIVNALRERKYTQFYTIRIGTKKVKKSRLVREFAIEPLDDLTVEELKTLAAKQATEKNLE